MESDLQDKMNETITAIAEAERRLYEEAPRSIGSNMRRYLNLKEKYNRLLGKYHSD